MPAESRREAVDPRGRVDALASVEDVSELSRRRDPEQAEMSVLNGLMRKMLADVDALCTLSPTNVVIVPLDARSVVLVDRRISCRRKTHAGEKITKINDFDSSTRSRIVLSLSSGEGNCLLQLGSP